MTSFVIIRPTLARLTQWALALDALHCPVALSSGRSLGRDRRRRPGGPRARWTDLQLQNDTGLVPGNLWRQAVLRGHGRPRRRRLEAFTTDAKIILSQSVCLTLRRFRHRRPPVTPENNYGHLGAERSGLFCRYALKPISVIPAPTSRPPTTLRAPLIFLDSCSALLGWLFGPSAPVPLRLHKLHQCKRKRSFTTLLQLWAIVNHYSEVVNWKSFTIPS